MRIGEHGFGDHLRLLAPLFGLIAAVWALRWIADIASAPPAQAGRGPALPRC